ncbi:carbonic anhydrase [Reyranella sp.]|uniref:carbonic anhydrase n=1 Tax=Reyranella sp. TaxID=1929291 RepID=UPI003BAA19E4
MCNDHSSHLPRRGLLAAGAAALVATQFTTPARAQLPTPPNAITPDAALKRIMEGNTRYAGNAMQNKDFSAGRAARAGAQYPVAGLVSCADSRVAPELVFDQGPGELFVVRVAGNFVTTDGLASLEYGVAVLGMPLIMVLGHSGCGAIDATIKVMKDKITLPGHLPDLVNAIKPAIDLAEKAKAANPLDEAIAQNVRYNVKRLQEAKPIIGEAVAAGKVKVVGGVYNIATGKVTLL